MRKPLALIVPTRNRIANARRLYSRLYDTVSGSCLVPDRDVFFVVGDEDPALRDYMYDDQRDTTDDEYSPLDTNRVKVFPDRGLVKALNWMAPQLTSRYECLAFMGDDHFPDTPYWDEKYVNELFRMGHGFVYGDDLLQGEKIPTQIAMTSSIVETLGFFTPPGFTHLCCDLAWKDLGEGIDRISYMPDVIIEHLHPANGKAENDEGYRWANSEKMVERDSEEYFRWSRDDLPGQIDQLNYALGLQ
jgi:hypothetical protein